MHMKEGGPLHELKGGRIKFDFIQIQWNIQGIRLPFRPFFGAETNNPLLILPTTDEGPEPPSRGGWGLVLAQQGIILAPVWIGFPIHFWIWVSTRGGAVSGSVAFEGATREATSQLRCVSLLPDHTIDNFS